MGAFKPLTMLPMLLQGPEFIFRVAIALLTLCQDTLLALDMEGVLKVLIVTLYLNYGTCALLICVVF